MHAPPRFRSARNSYNPVLVSLQVESALVLHPAVSEAAVVGFPDAIKGQAICCYVTFVSG